MTVPNLDDCLSYLGDNNSWDEDAVTAALSSESATQKRYCTIPQDDAGNDSYPADLLEACYRRVAHNLALRALPLGVSAAVSDAAIATNKVGGTDAEVARLERPYRTAVFG